MKSIVLAEKPSVARDLARVLNCTNKNKSYYEGATYIVTWALGHLVTLAEPGDIDNRYKEWKMDYLPMLPEKIGIKVINKTGHQFRAIQGLMNRKDVGSLVIATDAGREGELVARWIMKKARWNKPFSRLWISSQTDQSIKEGFASLKPGKEYNNLYAAAVCRAEADWLVGLNITRALTCKFEAQLTAGRVQTPTLAMMVFREEEIKNFKPRDFWTIKADFGDYTGYWRDADGKGRLFHFEKAEGIRKKIEGKTGRITDVKVQEKKVPPPLAFDLTELQREANKRYGFSAKKTLSLTQALYERHKMVTYPRTDSRHITTDMVKTLKARLDAVNTPPFDHLVKPLLGKELNPGKRFVDNSKVSDHHAIIPTETPFNPSRLDGDERRIYDLVVRRFLALLYPPYVYTSITITTEVEGETFVARGTNDKDLGWRKVEIPSPDDEDTDKELLPEQRLKEHAKGEEKKVGKISLDMGKTPPPPRYTEASLLSAMENPSKFISEKELKASIKKGGLGTPATRADIIEKLIRSFYVERQGKSMIPTSKGIELIKLVPGELKSPELTAKWEMRLEDIARGREQSRLFIEDIKKNASHLVREVKESKEQYKPANVSSRPCPMCGELMFKSREKGKSLLVCPNRSCGHKESEDRNDAFTYDSGRRGRRNSGQMRGLINKYKADEESTTSTFGDLIKAAMEKKEKGKKK